MAPPLPSRPAFRPRLKPGFRPMRRGPGAVQLGLSAASGGIILAGLEPAEVTLLEGLDGPLPEENLYAAAAGLGVKPARAAELLDLLRAHEVLQCDVAASERVSDGGGRPTGFRPPPAGRHVVVDGTGPLPAAIAALLRSCGVERVRAGRWAADLADAELRDRSGDPAVAPDLVVLVGQVGLDPRAGEPWRRRGIPQLPVVGDARRVIVGPLVSADPALPCLRCLQLARAERGAAWPGLLAQAASPSGETAAEPAGGPLPTRADLLSVAAGVVVMVADAALAGAPVPAGVSVEVTLPWPRLDHRRWSRHPACPSHAAYRARRAGPVGGSRPEPPSARVTMTP